jgi:hypothetical protein
MRRKMRRLRVLRKNVQNENAQGENAGSENLLDESVQGVQSEPVQNVNCRLRKITPKNPDYLPQLLIQVIISFNRS